MDDEVHRSVVGIVKRDLIDASGEVVGDGVYLQLDDGSLVLFTSAEDTPPSAGSFRTITATFEIM